MQLRWVVFSATVLVFSGLFVADYLPLSMVIWFAVLSVVCYCVYAKDKSAAASGEWRVKENTLHGLALLGGWPGALVAQQLLRHKTQKTRFLLVFWLCLPFNLAACYGVLQVF